MIEKQEFYNIDGKIYYSLNDEFPVKTVNGKYRKCKVVKQEPRYLAIAINKKFVSKFYPYKSIFDDYGNQIITWDEYKLFFENLRNEKEGYIEFIKNFDFNSLKNKQLSKIVGSLKKYAKI